MSISPVAGAAQHPATVSNAAKPESIETPGAADHDGDADNSAARAAAPQSPSTVPGGVNVKA